MLKYNKNVEKSVKVKHTETGDIEVFNGLANICSLSIWENINSQLSDPIFQIGFYLTPVFQCSTSKKLNSMAVL